MRTQEFVNGTTGTWELRIIVVVDNNNSLLVEPWRDEVERSFDRTLKVAIAEGKRDSRR